MEKELKQNCFLLKNYKRNHKNVLTVQDIKLKESQQEFIFVINAMQNSLEKLML